MTIFDAKIIVLVILSALFLPTEVSSQIIEVNCPIYWVQQYGTCHPWLRGGPGGRWRSGRRGRWRTGNLLPSIVSGPICPMGQIWVESFQECVPWLRGGRGGRWRAAMEMEPECPPAWTWNPDIGECVRPNLHVLG